MAGIVLDALPLPPETVVEQPKVALVAEKPIERVSDHADIARGQKAIRHVMERLEEWREKGSRPHG